MLGKRTEVGSCQTHKQCSLIGTKSEACLWVQKVSGKQDYGMKWRERRDYEKYFRFSLTVVDGFPILFSLTSGIGLVHLL